MRKNGAILRHMKQQLPEKVREVFACDEIVLWTMREPRFRGSEWWGSLFCLLLCMVALCSYFFKYGVMLPEVTPETWKVWLVFGVTPFVCGVWVQQCRKLGSALYVITDKRLLIVENAYGQGRMTVLFKNVTPLAVVKIKSRKNGVTDYILSAQRWGTSHHRIDVGLMRVPSACSPDSVLEHLGVVLPQKGEQHPETSFEHPGTPIIGVFVCALLIGILLARADRAGGAGFYVLLAILLLLCWNFCRHWREWRMQRQGRFRVVDMDGGETE